MAYTLVNVSANYRLDNHTSLDFQVQNLFDRRYEYVWYMSGKPSTPRRTGGPCSSPSQLSASLTLQWPKTPGRWAWWLALHRWLGLPSGLVFAVVGVSAFALPLLPGADLVLNSTPRPGQSWGRITLATRGGGAGAGAYLAMILPWRIEVPLTPGRPILAR